MSTAQVIKANEAEPLSTEPRRWLRYIGVVAGVLVFSAAVVTVGMWLYQDLPFSLRGDETKALQRHDVEQMLADAGIEDVRRDSDGQMYVVLKSGAKSRWACLWTGKPPVFPYGYCESRNPQGSKTLPVDFSYRLVRLMEVQYRGDAAPPYMTKQEFVSAIVGELRIALLLATELEQEEARKALVKQSWRDK